MALETSSKDFYSENETTEHSTCPIIMQMAKRDAFFLPWIFCTLKGICMEEGPKMLKSQNLIHIERIQIPIVGYYF